MKMTKCDFLESWIKENKDNILNKEVNEVYYTYTAQAFNAGHKPYGKKRFIEEVESMTECTKREFFY